METVATNALETILNAASQVITFSGSCLTAMVDNPIYVFYLAAGLVGVGLGIVGALRNTARG